MNGLFKSVVIISVVAYGIWFFIPYTWEFLYDDETRTIFQWNNYGSKINPSGPLPYVIGILYFIAAAGLISFRQWARTLFLLLTIVNFLLAPFWGIYISGGYDVMVGYIVILSDGVIITMAYLTSISNEFIKKA